MSGRACDLALMCVRKRQEAHMCAPRHIASARRRRRRRSCRVARSECSQLGDASASPARARACAVHSAFALAPAPVRLPLAATSGVFTITASVAGRTQLERAGSKERIGGPSRHRVRSGAAHDDQRRLRALDTAAAAPARSHP